MEKQTIVVYVDEEIADLIPEFLENRRRDVEQMKRLAQEGKYDELARLGHSMKGTGGGYGFMEISDMGKALEEAGTHGDREAAMSLCERLDTYLAAVTVQVRQPE
ncbi:Hpt domain protein [Candidatus Methylomirabilis lanthanidiphila]|uniref:Hpt domain protein n=1 Tax=Candidatus Methylomirabilis lanthanidiphila TaxID=2211376 RepID=A0A564ZEY5_9BACT|nr:Hpt domain-containing protein [Candidatus Methylomirabilis lanthanidiphila]VUZ83820.1 Hpt domain protein [Candidatus Methylomirabilis lanthanidiphila]